MLRVWSSCVVVALNVFPAAASVVSHPGSACSGREHVLPTVEGTAEVVGGGEKTLVCPTVTDESHATGGVRVHLRTYLTNECAVRTSSPGGAIVLTSVGRVVVPGTWGIHGWIPVEADRELFVSHRNTAGPGDYRVVTCDLPHPSYNIAQERVTAELRSYSLEPHPGGLTLGERLGETITGFEKQVRDPQWAGQREADIEVLVSKLDEPLELTHVECRETLCRIDFAAASPDLGAVLDSAVRSLELEVSRELLRESVLDKGVGTLWISRDGHPLPGD